MTDTAPILFEQSGHVVTLTLNRAEKRNALSGDDLFAAFEDHFQRINNDLSVRAVILTGAGKTFCAGGDVKEMRDKQGIFGGAPGGLRLGLANIDDDTQDELLVTRDYDSTTKVFDIFEDHAVLISTLHPGGSAGWV